MPATFSAVTARSRERAARLVQAWCGVMMQFGAASSGWSAGGGYAEHVEGRSGDDTRRERPGEIGLVDQPAARRVQEQRVLPHRDEPLAPHETLGALGERTMQRDYVGLAKERVHLVLGGLP